MTATEPATEAAQAAVLWLDGTGQALDALTADAQRRAAAWALKEAAYQSMYTDLPRALRAAQGVRSLRSQCADTRVQAELGALGHWLGGTVAALQGEPAQGLRQLQAAATAFTALAFPAHAAAAQVPQIVALAMLGRHEEAMGCAQATLSAFVALDDQAAAGKVHLNLGSMLLRQDRFAEAAHHYRRAAVRFARANDQRHSVMADIGLADALSWQFQFDEATRIYERAAARVLAHGLGALQGIIDAGRGMLALHRGEHAKALRWLEAALREFEISDPPQRLAEAKMDLGDAYLAVNLLPEAQQLFDEAAQLCRAHDAPVELARATAQLAVAHAAQGRESGAAELLEQARVAFETHGNAVGVAYLGVLQAQIALRRNDPARALGHAQAAGPALEQAGVRAWWLQALLAQAQAQLELQQTHAARASYERVCEAAPGLAEFQARALAGLAMLRRRGGDVRGALRLAEAAAGFAESQQARIQGDEFRTAYRLDKQDWFDLLAECVLDVGGPDTAQALLHALDRGRSRALHLGRSGLGASADTDATPAQPWQQQWHWLQRQWQHAAAAGDAQRAQALRERSIDVEREMLEAQRRAQAAAAQPAAGAGLESWRLPELQAALGAHRAMVVYGWLGERLVAVVVRAQGISWQSLQAGDLSTRIEGLRFQINSMRFGAPAFVQHGPQVLARVRAHLQALHARLWQPLQPALAGAQQVVVVPHRALHYVPFAALDDGHSPIVGHCAVTYAQSAGLWLQSQHRKPGREGGALVLGVGGDELPQVRAEAQAVAEVFGGRARVLLDDEATLPGLRQGLAAASHLHLACHGQFRADSPYFSSLKLGDGALTARDAAQLPLAGCSVALSACETALSRIAPGDEHLGLLRGFLLAGASVVLSSLWTVDDSSTAALMADYYRGLGQGLGPAEALRRAQQQVRERWPHPYHWAAFVLHGCA